MIKENTHGAAGKSQNDAVSSLDSHHSISNDSIMDFGFLQFHEVEINQSFDSAPLDSEVAFLHLKGIDHRSTISTNEVKYS